MPFSQARRDAEYLHSIQRFDVTFDDSQL